MADPIRFDISSFYSSGSSLDATPSIWGAQASVLFPVGGARHGTQLELGPTAQIGYRVSTGSRFSSTPAGGLSNDRLSPEATGVIPLAGIHMRFGKRNVFGFELTLAAGADFLAERDVSKLEFNRQGNLTVEQTSALPARVDPAVAATFGFLFHPGSLFLEEGHPLTGFHLGASFRFATQADPYAQEGVSLQPDLGYLVSLGYSL